MPWFPNEYLIRDLQQSLCAIGKRFQFTPGQVGEGTIQAIREFYDSHDMPFSNVIDSTVFKYLNIALKVRRNKLFLQNIQVYAFFPDDTGPDVYDIQRRLNAIGFHCVPNGYYDRHMTECVTQFQRFYHLFQSGVITPFCLELINI